MMFICLELIAGFKKHVGFSIFRIPTKVDDLSTKTSEARLRLVTQDREIDSTLRNQIDKRKTLQKTLLYPLILATVAIDPDYRNLVISHLHINTHIWFSLPFIYICWQCCCRTICRHVANNT